MTLVLDTIPAAVLASPMSTGTWSVEQTIKSTSYFQTEVLRDLWRMGKDKGLDAQYRLVVETAAALKAEREAAHEEALQATGTQACDGCSGDGVFRFPGGCFENGVWRGKTGQCFRCGGTGRQTIKDTRRNRFYDNNVRRVFA